MLQVMLNDSLQRDEGMTIQKNHWRYTQMLDVWYIYLHLA